jgi:transcription elongation factor Elf1
MNENDVVIPIARPAGEIPTVKTPTLPTFKVELPSKGLFYAESHPLASGVVELHQVTARHEDILSNQVLMKKGTVLDEFLKALVATKGVTLDDFLVNDKNALFVAARRAAYGDEYQTTITCPKCGAESKVAIDLSKIAVRTDVDYSKFEKGLNRFEFKLPSSQKTVVWKILSHRDETSIDAELKALAKVGSNTAELTTRLKYLIVSINGKEDRMAIKRFVDLELTSMDSLALRTEIRKVVPDMDMSFDFSCGKCGHEGRQSIPIGMEFFWPSAES